ncbi:hypothetical protein VNO77_07926 [Canavalia gladiata]|uniref:Uncharacterized protein n=1 Tax=Canavalia gladiata TaxID=3824 RepID=A0AAN9MDK2_CANGL
MPRSAEGNKSGLSVWDLHDPNLVEQLHSIALEVWNVTVGPFSDNEQFRLHMQGFLAEIMNTTKSAKLYAASVWHLKSEDVQKLRTLGVHHWLKGSHSPI